MNYKSFENQSNPYSTNIFESCVGALNLAPTKISGQYKIVVALDGKLYFDDYTGRQVLIDKTKSFLPQLGDFLKVKTELSNNTVLQYGGFQKSNRKFYHIPLYLGNDLKPKYYVLNRVLNENITNIDNIYDFNKVLQVIDLEKIGLHKIFDEILSEDYFRFPLYFDWENGNIKLFGYSITKNVPAIYKFDLTNIQANQPYFDVLNNKILNTFKQQNLVFPRFINIEFEFEYSNEYVPFNNFYGYISNGEKIITTELSQKSVGIKTQNYSDNSFVWEQFEKNQNVTLLPYIDIIGSGSIQEINIQTPQIRFKTSKLHVDDSIAIYHPNGDLEFEYVIKDSDIVETSLYQSLIKICKLATSQSKHIYEFSVKENSNYSCTIIIISNLGDTYDEEFVIKIPTYFQNIDKYSDSQKVNYFRGITDNDIWLTGQPTLLSNIEKIKIDEIFYTIVDKFKFDDKTIIRLDKNPQLTKLSECFLFQTKFEELYQLCPIPFLSYNSKLKSNKVYNINDYCDDLLTKFGENNIDFQKTINDFKSFALDSNHQYITENTILDDVDSIDLKDSNYEICLNMIFASLGQTSYLTPNTLNIDKQFFIQNGNIDINKLDTDQLKYNWFLIKGEAPAYLSSDIRNLRYFTTIPKITSQIIKTNEDFCETIFLGVKYQLPLKYEDFQFAVYLNFIDKVDVSINYTFDVDLSNKTIYLKVNKYLDFIDLLRGGDDKNTPLLDLSFFYSINASYNTKSDYLGDFKSSVIKLCDEVTDDEEIFYQGVRVYDWKKYTESDGKWHIALRREISSDETKLNDFTLLFPTIEVGKTEDFNVYVYQKITYNGIEYNYISMQATIVGIEEVRESYLWCSDVQIKFFPTDFIFASKYDLDKNIDEIFQLDIRKDDNHHQIIDSRNKTNNIFGDYVQITTILVDGQQKTFELLLPNKTLSLKESYFEILQTIASGSTQVTKTEFQFGTTYQPNTIIQNFSSDVIDSNVTNEKITLFHRNQIWRIVQDLFKIDLKFKLLSKSMVKQIMNKFMVTNLIDYSNSNLIKINNSTDYVNLNVVDIDRNIVVWNILNENKITLINRHKTLYFPYLPVCENEMNFQLPKNIKYNTIFNYYDINYGDLNKVKNNLFEEINGNLVSSLFCKEADLSLSISFSLDIDYKKLLIDSLDINEIYVSNINLEYIKKINLNTNEYILDNYVSYLLKTFYSFDSVLNEDNERIKYTVDSKNNTLLHFDNSILSKTLFFIFKRK